ncbi:ATP-binding protein [Clostridium sp. BJN0013]|uniref:ATP-binding protein n=1 Tax=Clostridium sp. BJN0013 TaxID=3236840 RepID=UPI0034C66A4E
MEVYNGNNEKVILEFSIENTGMGIKEEVKNQIFKKFICHQPPHSKYHSTTGLGLLISKELVKIINRNIWFESKENEGSTFNFMAEFLLDLNKTISEGNINLENTNWSEAADKIIICHDYR